MSGSCNQITRDGMQYIRWIHTLFGFCVYTNQDTLVSDIFGYLCVACWLNAQFPQVLTNYRNRSADGLSLPFLTNWLLGDIANLLGCILTNQLRFQIVLAVYFCIIDFILFCQYFYYMWLSTEILSESEEVPLPDRRLSMQSLKDSILEGAKKSYTFPARKKQSYKRIPSVVFAVLLFTFNSTSSISSSFSSSRFPTIHDEIGSQEMPLHGNAKLLSEHNVIFLGRVMAWTCTLFYLTSRMPQIWKNYTRSSVEGLSVFMFIFAALANLNYTLSILTNPLSGSEAYIRDAFPFILGSVGTLMFDVTIFLQWCIWRNAEPRKKRRSIYSGNYGSDAIRYHQLPTDDGSFRSGRYNRRSEINENFV
ncbi:7505_t:CDS:2 [Funneliformis mosseae]|uniref:7505_t:CDS:1 n=1 Tax=Funneliformis mosseae TaxID=27381 RepID=A0A9N9CUL2_FUNMO|nr:7505_t:CDS:2 [Funneliformis mosseae]